MVPRIQSFVHEWSSRILEMLARICRRRAAACLIAALLPMAIRLAALRTTPIPEPAWNDEYSYLLGADTLASGRLANPPHPMWKHFETFHVNWLPTYVTKFPPAQPLVLALGQRVFGHPWFGVLISFGLMGAAICWMLQAWMPPVYALLGALLGIAQVGIFRYWMDSYCGGAVAAIGGCLVIGAAARLAAGTRRGAPALGALGLMLLANSRPFEGLVVALIAGTVVVARRRSRRRLGQLLTAPVLVPFLFIIGVVGCWMAYYNYRTTGSPVTLPYMVNARMYEANPQFWLLPAGPIPEYRHAVIRNIWTVWTRDQWVRARQNPLAVVPRFASSLAFFWSPLLLLYAAFGLLIARSLKVWITVAMALAFFVSLLLQVDVSPHYFAPAIFVLIVPVMYTMRWLRVTLRRSGPALVLLLVAAAFTKAFQADHYHVWREAPSRREAVTELNAKGGRHVVFVRYASDDEIVPVDLVYNRADIDGSPIVWARYMGPDEDRELVDYYRDRSAWIFEADAKPPVLRPYPIQTR